ncbi:ABC transporter family substrate-binding protein [Austwickia chelonae]|uniref:ABC transporter family substrate-binding protein n=1 Tax=Austwickia chelonae TaxID=100225 RepID=UPI000E28A5CB|nr:ABC transporter family substrate-binding protein [Austwickia chelonae]
MTRNPSRTAFALCVCASLTLAGCSSGNKDGKAGPEKQDINQASKLVANNPKDRGSLEQGGTLTLEIGDWPTNYNGSHIDGNGAEYHEITNATDPVLFEWEPDGKIKPNKDYLEEMPKSETKDGKQVITYTMNPKAKWNDGTPIDWTAFEAFWKAYRAPMDKGGYGNISTTGFENIASVAKGDADNKVVVTMDKPFYPAPELFQILIHPKLGVDAKTFNEAMKTEFHPEWRSGPFTLENIDNQAKTFVLKRNPNWWGDKPLLDKVIFRQMEDSATIPAFKNGEIDATSVGNKSRYQQIQGAKDLDIRRSQRLVIGVNVFNTKAEGLADINVRKAMWQAYDREEWKKVRFDGLNWTEKPTDSTNFFTFQPEYEPAMPVTHSVDDAKKTLEGAGYTMGGDGFYAKDGKKVTVKYTTFGDDPMARALAQTVQSQMKKAGIDLQIDQRPAASFSDTVNKREFGLLAMAWSSTTAWPIANICQVMCTDSQSNYSSTGTKELDERIRKLGAIEDPNAQAKEMNAIEKEWNQQYGQLPIATSPLILATRKGLANYGPAAFAFMHPRWQDVGWEKGSTHK